MSWFKVDDQAAGHLKMREATKDGRVIWWVAGVESARLKTDGVVSFRLLHDAAHLAEMTKTATNRAARALVEAGLWHDADTIKACRRCTVHLEPDEHYFHDWLDYQPTRDDTELPEYRLRVRRKRALAKDRNLCDAVWERDRGLCRYCSVRVNSADRRGATGATYDHIDPAGPNTLANLALSCRRCNGRKGDRTPAEAGMVLLSVPEPYDPDQTRSEPDRDQNGIGSDLTLPSRDARDGPDRVGTGSEPGSGQVGTDPGPGSDLKDPTEGGAENG